MEPWLYIILKIRTKQSFLILPLCYHINCLPFLSEPLKTSYIHHLYFLCNHPLSYTPIYSTGELDSLWAISNSVHQKLSHYPGHLLKSLLHLNSIISNWKWKSGNHFGARHLNKSFCPCPVPVLVFWPSSCLASAFVIDSFTSLPLASSPSDLLSEQILLFLWSKVT